MAIIQFTGRGPVHHGRPAPRALAQAAVAASRASSIFNSQPWRWQIADDVAGLYADRGGQPATVDPDDRLLTVSCGAALHHARTALAGTGFAADVTYLPDPADPDLLARIRVVGAGAPTTAAVRLQLAMALRQTSRPFADRAVPPAVLGRLRDAAEAYGAHLRALRPDEAGALAAAAARAHESGSTDPRCRAGGPAPTGRPAGIPDTAPPKRAGRRACRALLYTDGDTPADWLAAGEALSAVLLTATAERVVATPIDALVGASPARQAARGLLGGAGYPVAVLGVGVPDGRLGKVAGDHHVAAASPAVPAT